MYCAIPLLLCEGTRALVHTARVRQAKFQHWPLPAAHRWGFSHIVVNTKKKHWKFVNACECSLESWTLYKIVFKTCLEISSLKHVSKYSRINYRSVPVCAVRCSSTRIPKGSRAQGFKGSRDQELKGSRVQGFKGSIPRPPISLSLYLLAS